MSSILLSQMQIHMSHDQVSVGVSSIDILNLLNMFSLQNWRKQMSQSITSMVLHFPVQVFLDFAFVDKTHRGIYLASCGCFSLFHSD